MASMRSSGCSLQRHHCASVADSVSKQEIDVGLNVCNNFTATVVELKTLQQTAKSAGTLQWPLVDPTGRQATGLIQESETDVRIICKKLLSPKVCICWKKISTKKINTVLPHKKVSEKLRMKLLSVFSVSTFMFFLSPFLLFYLFFPSFYFSLLFPPLSVSLVSPCVCSVWAKPSSWAAALMVHSVGNSSPWACVNLSLPPVFHTISSLFFMLLLLHFISRRFVLMDFAVILPFNAICF